MLRIKKPILLLFLLSIKLLIGQNIGDVNYGVPVCEFDPNPIVIEFDETWENYAKINSEVIINNGATLTITGRRAFVEDAKIIVEVGSKLIIDGGVLTNACDGLWKGIEVWGNPLLPQIPLENQGYIYLKNGAVIKNAETAIAAIKIDEYDTPDYDFSGGIVFANNSDFINNKTAVALYNYSENYLCSFYKCKFKTTQLLYDKEYPNAFVTLCGVKGVFFKGCEFSNTASLEEYYPGARGFGIFSYNADYVVKEACVSQVYPCEEILPSSFSNLCFGILALVSDFISTVRIENNEFVNNYSHIFLSGLNQPEINMNNFTLNSGELAFNNYSGLYLDYCTGYQVEENSFIADDRQSEQAGIVVNNSGTEPNEVYNNYFENLGVGVLAQECNRNASGIEGLQIKCNDFSLCEYDIAVTPEGAAGIAASQGSESSNPEDMAGNLFYIPGPANGDFDDIANETQLFSYYYPDLTTGYGNDRLEPIDFTENTVNDEPVVFLPPGWSFAEGCPSHLNQGGGIEDLKSEISIADQKIDSTENILNLFIDGGDTDELQSDVEYSTPPETMDIYNDLMSESPYLSDTVVSTAIEKEDVLPNAMIRDIMVANPNTAKANMLMDKLDERYDPLPDYMKAQILQGRSILSIREETETDLARFKAKKARAFNEIIRHYRRDTLNPQASADSILIMYQNENQLWAKYALAFEYLSRDDSANTMSTLDSIPLIFDLTASQLAVQQHYYDYFEILTGLISEGKTVSQIDSADKAQLYSILDNSNADIKVYVRNLLITIDTLTYHEPYFFPDMLKSADAYEDYLEILNAKKPGYLNVHPNPAKDYIIIKYKLEIEKPCFIDITNLSSNLITTIQLFYNHDQEVVDTRMWKTGLYIATLKVNGKPVESTKFSIIK